jgi:2-oxoisovalerate dehydrogenase E1 component alpha subunit
MQDGGTDIATSRTPSSAVSTGGLNDRHLLDIYGQMVLCRTLDERVWMLNRQGKAAIVASAQGHEAAQVGSVWALRKGVDNFYIYYRDLAVLVSLGMTPAEIMLGFVAKAGEPLSAARQFPVHGAYPALGIVNLSNVVGTQIPQAGGAALASRMRGEDTVTICYFGDGAASVGDCHEAMNYAAIHKLPVIFFCENNGYAISVPLSKQMAVDSVAGRAEGYGMPGSVVDGADIAAVHEATAEAAARALAGDGPTLVEAMVERYLPHTSDDDDSRYRPREDIEEARKRDPLRILGERLTASGVLTQEVESRLREDAVRAVNEATEHVERAPYPDTDDFSDHVYGGGAPSP